MYCEQRIKTLINEYKRILKRHLPRNQCSDRINALLIKRKHLRLATHSELYEKSITVLEDIDELINARPNHPSNFCGLRAFAEHLKDALKTHVLNENEKMINAPQKASKAVVDTIQLITISPIEKQLQQIQDNIHIAIKYGSHDQKKLLIKALNQQSAQCAILQPLVQKLAS